ncbi:nitrite reductase large subunit NirB [Paenibacillus larvae]
MPNKQKRKKWLVIGNGMAGMNTVEQVIKLAPDLYDITVIGSEPYPNYNRIQLSYVLEGSKTVEDIVLNDYDWYKNNNIDLHTGRTAEHIDREKKLVRDNLGTAYPYDILLLATGSNPFILPVPGTDLEGVVGFRDISDCNRMMEAAKTYRKAAVIGGGLLGLEAAKGLSKLGMEVTVVHLFDELMERQLDPVASTLLKAELEEQGLRFATGKQTEALTGTDRVQGIRFTDGTELAADFVVMAVGIRPNTALAKASGLEVNRGIIVNDVMQTSDPAIYAVGECNEHRGVCYGLVAPLFEQGQVLAKHLCGIETPGYAGTVLSTKLKISGVDVFSAGEFMDKPGMTVVKMQDDWRRIYKKILLRDNKIVGGVLFGDNSEAPRLQQWIRTGAEMTDAIYASVMEMALEADPGSGVAGMPDEEIVCGCNGVTKGAIVAAIRDNGLTSVDEIKSCTGACRSCGGCKPVVEQILQHTLGDQYDTAASANGICSCTDKSRDEIVAAIREKELKTIQDVMRTLDWKEEEGCSKCRPALNYYLTMLWPAEYQDEKVSRFVNERMHANINKDGTYTVVPRMYGGVTSPDELLRIAEVAKKYEVPCVKMTGGQRLDLIGVKKEDLPKVWEEIDMPSGYAYAKSLRTVKTCVGAAYCRFGTVDSMGMGARLERKMERLDMPAKVKLAVNGCPRNCAESCTKDVGIVGNDGGWEIYVGGNGGIKPRLADLMAKVKTDEEVVEVTQGFIQYYREQANYLERTSEFVERIGLSKIIKEVVDNREQRLKLVARMELALSQVKDPWKEVIDSGKTRKDLYEHAVFPQF